MTVIDTRTHTATATIDVGTGPEGVVIDPGMHIAYVANGLDPNDLNHEVGTVTVIDTTSLEVTDTIPAAFTWNGGLVIDQDAHTTYVANNQSISVIDTTTNRITATIDPGRGEVLSSNEERGGAVDPAAHRVYVTNTDNHSLSVIDTNTNKVTATVQVGTECRGIAVDPTTNTVDVAN